MILVVKVQKVLRLKGMRMLKRMVRLRFRQRIRL